jgi:hypothetical protein
LVCQGILQCLQCDYYHIVSLSFYFYLAFSQRLCLDFSFTFSFHFGLYFGQSVNVAVNQFFCFNLGFTFSFNLNLTVIQFLSFNLSLNFYFSVNLTFCFTVTILVLKEQLNIFWDRNQFLVPARLI